MLRTRDQKGTQIPPLSNHRESSEGKDGLTQLTTKQQQVHGPWARGDNATRPHVHTETLNPNSAHIKEPKQCCESLHYGRTMLGLCLACAWLMPAAPYMSDLEANDHIAGRPTLEVSAPHQVLLQDSAALLWKPNARTNLSLDRLSQSNGCDAPWLRQQAMEPVSASGVKTYPGHPDYTSVTLTPSAADLSPLPTHLYRGTGSTFWAPQFDAPFYTPKNNQKVRKRLSRGPRSGAKAHGEPRPLKTCKNTCKIDVLTMSIKLSFGALGCLIFTPGSSKWAPKLPKGSSKCQKCHHS